MHGPYSSNNSRRASPGLVAFSSSALIRLKSFLPPSWYASSPHKVRTTIPSGFVDGFPGWVVQVALVIDGKPKASAIFAPDIDLLYTAQEGAGAYCNGNKISVSNTLNKKNASICTGFPVRFNTQNNDEMQNFWNLISPYAKVRMLGTAAISLINVAKGSADVYTEQSIMLWDVAAGIAIIEGSGGCIYSEKGPHEYSLNVFASNKPLFKYH